MTMSNIQFGSGVLFGLPNSGNTAANPTPSKLGLLQDFEVDFKADLKKLFGQKQFAAATARGKIDVTCKAKIAVFDLASLNQLYFGQSLTTGMTRVADSEAGSIPASSTYTITVTNSSTFVDDLGVVYAASGAPLTNVGSASLTAVGQYKVDTATGIYTFYSGDASGSVLISYTYTVTTAGTSTLALSNQLMGYAPQFKAIAYNNFRSKYLGIQLNQCTMGSLNLASKLEDFWMFDITFDANTDASDNLGKLFASNV
jgi:hypothetical protein